MSASFDEILRAWILYYDDRLPSDRTERRKAFITLLGNLKDHGYNKDTLSNKKEKIIRACVNPFHNKQKLKRWVSMLVNDLDSAISIYYETVKIRDNVVTPEMSEKLCNLALRAEETKALRTENSEESNEPEENLLELSETDKIDISQAIDNQSQIKESAITNEMLDEMEAPEVVWDEDFYKKMGME